MKRFGVYALALTLTVIFCSCDSNVTIFTNSKSSSYNPRLHLSAVGENEKLPNGVRELLNQNSDKKKSIAKFPLSYYLIQEEDTTFLRTKKFDTEIVDQLDSSVSGDRYFKLFVHPDSDAVYAFLKHAYRYIGPDETEFVASSIPGNKTVVVWTKKNLKKTPFIVKTVLDQASMQEISSRFPATAPEMATLIFKRKIKGTNEKIEGQQITPVPQF